MRTTTKAAEVVSFKALSDEAPGTFEALVAVFDVIDRQGEVVPQGAFTETLTRNPRPPVVWSHMWSTPPVGETIEAAESSSGLVVKGRFFVEEGVQLARDIWTAMKAGALKEWSFGATVVSEHFETVDERQVAVLDVLELVEYGPALRGVNPDTATTSIKAEQLVREIERGHLSTDELRKALDDPTAALDGSAHSSPRGGLTPEERRVIASVLLS